MRKPQLALGFLLTLAACATAIHVDKNARGPSAIVYGGKEIPPGLIGQDAADFEHLSEGSDIYPYDWMRVLKSATDEKPFLNNLNEKFGILPSDHLQTERVSPDGSNKEKLHYLIPYMGLTSSWSNHPVDKSDAYREETGELVRNINGVKSIKMVGVNCVICHSSEIRYKGKSFKVDGAPNMANIRGFFQDLSVSTILTVKDKSKLTQFLKDLNVPGAEAKAAEVNAFFEQEFGKQTGWGLSSASTLRTFFEAKALNDRTRLFKGDGAIAKTLEKLLRVTYGFSDQENIGELRQRMIFLGKLMVGTNPKTNETVSGFNRTDAFGRIGNLILRTNNPIDYTAPVSLPWIWGIKYTAMLHYTANTNSVMLRNMGQSLGLGAIILDKEGTSTVNVHNLNRLENLAHKIKVPYWEKMFSGIDELKPYPSKVEAGKKIYDSRCIHCHTTDERVGPQHVLYNYKVKPLNEIKTDQMAAKNVVIPVEGKDFNSVIFTNTENVKAKYYSDNHVTPEMQSAYEFRDLRGNEFFRDTLKGYGKLSQLKDGNNYGEILPGEAYMARHLAGVWSTGPYLHNGSVPSIWELLKPADQRPRIFDVRSRELNPWTLGFESERAKDSSGNYLPCGKKEDSCFDTSLVGNSNKGHEGHIYGTDLNDTDKAALIEYLKVLPPEPEYSW